MSINGRLSRLEEVIKPPSDTCDHVNVFEDVNHTGIVPDEMLSTCRICGLEPARVIHVQFWDGWEDTIGG